MGHFSEQNFYEILEISSNATTEEIQKAFFKAKSTYSPTSAALYSVFSESEAQQLLRLIDEAYAVLSNSAKRREYDKSLSVPSSDDKKATVTPLPTHASIQPSSSITDDLPDFMLPENEKISSRTERSTELFDPQILSTPEPSPHFIDRKSTGKTIVSHYNVDDVFENEIRNQNVFDGTFLQKVRHYKNISLDQISEISRISRPYIVSVETNDFNALPAPVYVRGFISSIARLLGLNEKKVADSYMKLFKDSRGK